ncbi:MAG: UvrB/UvrC protein [Phycisphaeraceae bacterium]|nr:MAG: UvrB/UvrC protein [Phycisphaeraceae bacterium]
MDRDLSRLLEEWPYEPGRINVRLIRGDGGDPLVQVRLDLGILQMSVDGRPEGPRGPDAPSVLEIHEGRADELSMVEDDEDGPTTPPVPDPEGLGLTPEECRALREEAMQYAHRYVALLVLEDFEGVVRDTTRNLRVVELLSEHAKSDGDKNSLEPQRAYLLMMRARARASLAMKDGEPRAALLAIDEGLDELRACFEGQGQGEAFEASKEASVLRGMREALVPKLPVSQRAELRTRLDEALASENYELAAILRDELRMLPE